jgi:hypothetical protein
LRDRQARGTGNGRQKHRGHEQALEKAEAQLIELHG